MSCNQEHFLKQEALIRQRLFGKDILNGEYPNIDIYFYAASKDGKYHYNKNTHRMEVPCDDSIFGTYEKTMLAFNMLDAMNIEYDYIFRTNCSTMINLRNLRDYINGITDEEKIYVGQIYSTPDGSGPEPYDFYGIGKSIILSKKWVDIIRNYNINDCEKFITNKELLDRTKYNIWKVDDNAIGMIINCYCMENGIDKYDVYRSFITYPGWNDNYYYEQNRKQLISQIAIPFRTYGENREIEFDRAVYLWEVVGINKKAIKNVHEVLDFNDSVFLMQDARIHIIGRKTYMNAKNNGNFSEMIDKLFSKS